ncbi:MAG: CapA family protein [Bacteroidia bacterium]|nr:CapA family protein [Bacteroidia bacterium]
MIKLGFVGDFCPIGRTEKLNSIQKLNDAYGEILPLFVANDLNLINLECPLTNSENRIKKTGPHIKAKPATIEILNYFNCKLVTTANNHFMDFGIKGSNETYSVLGGNKINWIGSGSNIEEAANFSIQSIKDMKIAFFNMTETEWTTTSGAEAGCNPLDLPRALLTIKKAKESGADKVIAILHGGHEHYPYPSPRMKSQYRFMIDAGADAVVSHHAHIISGYEVYKGCPIFYGLGNFIFDWPDLRNSDWNKGLFLNLFVEPNKPITFKYTFFHQNNENVGVFPLNDEESANEEIKLTLINEIIADDDKLNDYFAEYCKKEALTMLQRLQPYKSRVMTALFRKGLLPDLMGKEKRKMIKAIVQCEAHRDVLLNTLKHHI